MNFGWMLKCIFSHNRSTWILNRFVLHRSWCYQSGPCCGGRWTGCAGRWTRLGPPCRSRSAAAPPGWEDLSPCAPWLGCSWTTRGRTEGMVWLLFQIFNLQGKLSNCQWLPVWHSCRATDSHLGATTTRWRSSAGLSSMRAFFRHFFMLTHNQYTPDHSVTNNKRAQQHCSLSLTNSHHYTVGLCFFFL